MFTDNTSQTNIADLGLGWTFLLFLYLKI